MRLCEIMSFQTHQNMRLERVKTDKYAWLFIFIAGICFYIFNVLTPEVYDDYIYKFIFERNSDPETPVNTIEDICLSQYNHYFTANGRIIVHFIAQLFSGILGKNLFNTANAIVFCALLYYFYLSSNKNLMLLSISTFLLFAFIPVFNETHLWMTGSINYMWSALIVLMFLYYFNRLKCKPIKWRMSILLILGVITGWFHEGVTFPLALGVVVYIIIYRKTIFRSAAIFLALGFVIGGFLCALSPGTIGRASINGDFSLTSKLITGVYLFFKLKLVFILCILILFRKTVGLKMPVKVWVKENILVIVALISSFGIIFSGHSTSRVLFGLEFFALILIIQFLFQIKFSKRKQRLFTTISVIGLIVIFGLTLPYSVKNYNESKSIITQIKAIDSYIIKTDETRVPDLLSRFVQAPLEYNDCYVPLFWRNKYIAKTYGKDSLVFIPRDLIEDIKLNPSRYNHFYTEKEWPFYVKRVEGVSIPRSVTFLLNETDFSSLPFYIRPFAHKMEKYTATEISAGKYGVNNLLGDNYLMVGKNWLIDNRVKKVVCVP